MMIFSVKAHKKMNQFVKVLTQKLKHKEMTNKLLSLNKYCQKLEEDNHALNERLHSQNVLNQELDHKNVLLEANYSSKLSEVAVLKKCLQQNTDITKDLKDVLVNTSNTLELTKKLKEYKKLHSNSKLPNFKIHMYEKPQQSYITMNHSSRHDTNESLTANIPTYEDDPAISHPYNVFPAYNSLPRDQRQFSAHRSGNELNSPKTVFVAQNRLSMNQPNIYASPVGNKRLNSCTKLDSRASRQPYGRHLPSSNTIDFSSCNKRIIDLQDHEIQDRPAIYEEINNDDHEYFQSNSLQSSTEKAASSLISHIQMASVLNEDHIHDGRMGYRYKTSGEKTREGATTDAHNRMIGVQQFSFDKNID